MHTLCPCIHARTWQRESDVRTLTLTLALTLTLTLTLTWQRESDVLCVLAEQLRLDPGLARRLAAALGHSALEIDPHLSYAEPAWC